MTQRIASILRLKTVTAEQVESLLDAIGVPSVTGEGNANPFYAEVINAAVEGDAQTLLSSSVARDLLFNGSPCKFTLTINEDGWFPLWSLYVGDQPQWDTLKATLFEFYADPDSGVTATVPVDDKDAVHWLREVWREIAPAAVEGGVA